MVKLSIPGRVLLLALVLISGGACNQIAGIADYHEVSGDGGARGDASADAGRGPAADAAVVGLDASDGAASEDARAAVGDAQPVTPAVDAEVAADAGSALGDGALPANDAAAVVPPADAGALPPGCVLLTVEVHAGPGAATAVELKDALPPFVVTVVDVSKQVCLAPGTAISLRGVGDTSDAVHTWQPAALCGGSGRRCDFTLQEPTVVSVIL